MVLWEEDGLFVGDICTRLRLDNGTLTPLLKKMEKQGFVVRRRDETDERKVRVFLTDEGRAMKERVRDIPRKVGSCVDLNTEEARTLYRLLYKLLDEA